MHPSNYFESRMGMLTSFVLPPPMTELYWASGKMMSNVVFHSLLLVRYHQLEQLFTILELVDSLVPLAGLHPITKNCIQPVSGQRITRGVWSVFTWKALSSLLPGITHTHQTWSVWLPAWNYPESLWKAGLAPRLGIKIMAESCWFSFSNDLDLFSMHVHISFPFRFLVLIF